eukprot:gb/GECG01010330.1/.p1 GENE.gb/GECG01010330.1/~~gb/GECG01010330.1/.p1  ORF type:complete len:841 (+),score=131.18 gb/GECG01010330.1/:1-2523(+)
MASSNKEQAREWNRKAIKVSGTPEALTYYDKAIQLDPHTTVYLSNKAKSLAKMRRLEDAIACYNRIIAMDPNNTAAYHQKGIELAWSNRFQEAAACYDQAISLNRGTAADAKLSTVFKDKTIALAWLGQWTNSLAAAEKALALGETDAELHRTMSTAYRELKDYEKAMACCDRALQIQPDFAKALQSKGRILAKQGKHVEALPYFDRAIALDSKMTENYLDKARSQVFLERYEQAIESFAKELKLQPKCQEAINERKNVQSLLQQKKQELEETKELEKSNRTNRNAAVASATEPADDGKPPASHATNSIPMSDVGHEQTLTSGEIKEGLEQIQQLAPQLGKFVLKREVDEAIMSNDTQKQFRIETAYIRDQPALLEFYRSFNGVLYDAFTAASVIQSGDVDVKLGTMKSCVVSALDLIAQHFPPFSIVTAATQSILKSRKEGDLKKLLDVLPLRSDMSNIIEEVSRVVTIALSDSIESLDPEIEDQRRLWEFFEKVKFKYFSRSKPKSIYECKGASEGIALLCACSKGLIEPGRFRGEEVLPLFLLSGMTLDSVQAKREHIARLFDFDVGKSSTYDNVKCEHPAQPTPSETSGESSRSDESALREEMRHLREEMEKANLANDTESLRQRLEEIEKQLPKPEDNDVTGGSEAQNMISPDGATGQRSEASGAYKFAVQAAREVEDLKERLFYHETRALQAHRASQIRRRFQDSQFPFVVALNKLKRVLNRYHGGPDKHPYRRDPNTFDVMFRRKKSIAKALQGTRNVRPERVSGKVVMAFIGGDTALTDIPREQIYEAFGFDSEGEEYYGGKSFANTTESTESRENRHRLVGKSEKDDHHRH